jgi:hypothetical protein
MTLDKIITLRVNNENLGKLRNEARKEELSLNSLVNHIFSDYLQWDMFANKVGWIIVLSDVFKGILDELDEKALQKVAIHTANTTANIGSMMTGENTLDGFFFILRNRLKKSGIQYVESTENGITKFTIHHNLGKNWSYFYKVWHEQMLKNLGFPSTISSNENSLIISVPLNKQELLL